MLGVETDISKSDLGKSYRSLARKWHPDRFKTKVRQIFRLVVKLTFPPQNLSSLSERERESFDDVYEDCERLRGMRASLKVKGHY